MNLDFGHSLFLQEYVPDLYVPSREDLFQHQITVLNSYYSLADLWKSFETSINLEFRGDFVAYRHELDVYGTKFLAYYDQNEVNAKILKLSSDSSLVPAKNFKILQRILPGHTYFKVRVPHIYSKVLEFFGIIPLTEKELQSQFTDKSLIQESQTGYQLSHCTLVKGALNILASNLLESIETDEFKFFKQLHISEIRAFRSGFEELYYDITGLEEFFTPFVGTFEYRGISFNTSIEKVENLLIYHDYRIYSVPLAVNLQSGQKKLCGTEEKLKTFLPQVIKLDQAELIQEKDLYWEDKNGLHKYEKPVRQILLGPETIIE